ncbi:unnamed protein product, partial [Coregonus sp. 'balchen']
MYLMRRTKIQNSERTSRKCKYLTKSWLQGSQMKKRSREKGRKSIKNYDRNYCEEVDFVPVFGTQVPNKEYERHNRQLASGAGGPVQMTQEEQDHLDDLLRDMEEEEGDNYGKACCEVGQHTALIGSMETYWPFQYQRVTVYSPEPAEQDQLIHIDTRLQLLLPVKDFLSVRRPYPEHSLPQTQ